LGVVIRVSTPRFRCSEHSTATHDTATQHATLGSRASLPNRAPPPPAPPPAPRSLRPDRQNARHQSSNAPPRRARFCKFFIATLPSRLSSQRWPPERRGRWRDAAHANSLSAAQSSPARGWVAVPEAREVTEDAEKTVRSAHSQPRAHTAPSLVDTYPAMARYQPLALRQQRSGPAARISRSAVSQLVLVFNVCSLQYTNCTATVYH
jgi:hypothetical protein